MSNPSGIHRGWNLGRADATHANTGNVLEALVPGDGTNTASRQLHIAQSTDGCTDWGLAAQSHPMLVLHSTTVPATNYTTFQHDGTCFTINAASGNLAFQIDGTSEYTVSSTVFDLASVDLQMQCGGQILDNAGLELIEFVAVCTAVNGFRISNNSTGLKPTIQTEGEADTGIIFAGWDGSTSEEILILCASSTAVNEITITSAAANADPDIAATGGDTNVALSLSTKAAGHFQFDTGGTPAYAIHDTTCNPLPASTSGTGHDLFMYSQQGLASCGATCATAGGRWTIETGVGGIGSDACNQAGAVGGRLCIATGIGGASTASDTAAGGAGGALCITTGNGGVASSGSSGNAGAGGLLKLTSGDAGAISGGTGAPAIGGGLTIGPGTGSTSSVACDTSGAGGALCVAGGAGGTTTGSGASSQSGAGGGACFAGGAGGASCNGSGGNGGDVTISVGVGGVGTGCTAGGDAGDIFLRLQTAVEGGAVGELFIRNATTGLGLAIATVACTTWSDIDNGAGNVYAVTGWLATTASPANVAVMVIETA